MLSWSGRATPTLTRRIKQAIAEWYVPNPLAKRTHLLRSYLRHALCDQRMWGHTVRQLTYYRCSPKPDHHGHLPWFGAPTRRT